MSVVIVAVELLCSFIQSNMIWSSISAEIFIFIFDILREVKFYTKAYVRSYVYNFVEVRIFRI